MKEKIPNSVFFAISSQNFGVPQNQPGKLFKIWIIGFTSIDCFSVSVIQELVTF